MKTACAASFVLFLTCISAESVAQESAISSSQVGVPATQNADAVSSGEPGDWNLGGSVRSQWVLLDEDKTLRGRIGTIDNVGKFASIPDLEVRLYQSTEEEDGVTWKGESTGNNGEFQIKDLSGGVYQLIATGRDGFLAFSLIVFERRGNPAAQARKDEFFRLVQVPLGTRTRFDVVAAAVPPTFISLNLILGERFPEMTKTDLAPQDHAESVQASAKDRAPGNDLPGGPLEKRGLRELEQNQPGMDQSIPATTIQSHVVPLLAGNELRGRLFAIDAEDGHPILVEDVFIFILRTDEIVYGPERVVRGEFSAYLDDGEGAYSIVAIGKNGFGASSFYARPVGDEEEAFQMMHEKTSFVSTRLAAVGDDPGPELVPPLQRNANRAFAHPFAMALINDPKVLQDALPRLAQAGMAAQPFPPPGPMPGGGAGGGAAGGVGLGPLLGLGGLAGLAGLAKDRERTVVIASPFQP
jgi:hypothetical protein